MNETAKAAVESGKTVLGIEFGSTRIKAVLIDESHAPIAMGTYDWENRLENDIWTYSLEDVRKGLQGCYRSLTEQVRERCGTELNVVGAIGISGMMHGYMAFDKDGRLLAPFRTWRNTITEEAARKLTGVFGFNVPQRWSISHLYQAILNGEEHVKDVATITTLSGYVHWMLTGVKALGVGEASGMFPIDSAAVDYNRRMVEQFDGLTAGKGYPWKLEELLPRVLAAGDDAGTLTPEGAELLDPSGRLEAGIPLCPPEGDAGTGMVATDSVAPRTGNVSAGTSVFAMVVMEEPLSKVHEEIDMVTTPDGLPVAMVHCNNCTSDLNSWIGLFGEFAEAMGFQTDKGRLFQTLFGKALEGDADCGGLLAYNYFSGEPVTGFEEGRPLFARMPDSRLTLANFMRAHLFSSLAALKIGLDILLKEEHAKVDRIMGHGGFFKTPVVGQRMMAAAMDAPVTVMDNAGEGGAWGIAILAAYRIYRKPGETLPVYLENRVFAGQKGSTVNPDDKDVRGFDTFLERYTDCLPCERAAVDGLNW